MFDFDTPVDRTGSDSHKWQKYAGRDILPMWVADMDFRSPPAVMEALQQRVEHGVFGYGRPDPALTDAVLRHLLETYGWEVSPEWIVWLPGLVTGINVTVRTVGEQGSAVVTHVPVYPPFLNAPALWQRELRTTPLIYDGRQWQMDWDQLQSVLGHRTRLYLLCNPQNPTGRVFTRRELTALAQICLEADLVVCADEIHCDLILTPEKRHIPFATLGPEVAARTITLMAPSKTFNVPGLGCAFAIISDSGLRHRFKQAMAGIVPHVNVLGFAAARAAYASGGPWLKALLEYLRANRDLTTQAINQMPGLHMGPVEGTYLAWIDTRSSSIEHPAPFFEAAGVGLSDGTGFGGPGFVRLNFGCNKGLLVEGLERMAVVMAGVG
ncbi:MalY/PatB family protein [Desulfatitalea alkaliphila]|uniref:cysteine-S-conjugate beta-lyase n=1 Tax=Desulfatitalea alkaliphila TaxID=2929485 RepID=A0AA41UR49_9BACT|nr:PatB family C-S lyase [Desulfatitalea alkaliphila]MCJ8502003.1 PatB family C-S lyase [Desulfatitalea alkaliphila]